MLQTGREPIQVYFAHSYAVETDDAALIAARCDHTPRFVAAVQRGNLHAVQFHPEKSGQTGSRMLARFAVRCERG